MRRSILLLPLLFACGKAEAPPADTAAAAPPPAPAVVALMDADIAGKWAGVTKPEGSDSVVGKWTQECGNGTCKGTIEGMKEVMTSTYVIAGDSAAGTSAAMMDPMLKMKVTDHWTLRLKDGKVVGTGLNRLADKPDSVVFRYTFEGSRTP